MHCPSKRHHTAPLEHGSKKQPAEIDLATEHQETEQGDTAATDLGLAAEQVAMHAICSHQAAAQAATVQGTVQPPMHMYSDLPRMANGQAVHFL